MAFAPLAPDAPGMAPPKRDAKIIRGSPGGAASAEGGLPMTRRLLTFASVPDILAEVRSLADRPHRTVGNWTLAQVCRHLADTINGSMDGLDLSRHRFKRFFLSKRLLQYTFRHGIPPGYTVDPRLNPPPDVTLEASVAALERAIARYQSYEGRLRPHPLFGDLSRGTWDRLHCFHGAHHLSFVIPSDG
jgi:hypothetical protein